MNMSTIFILFFLDNLGWWVGPWHFNSQGLSLKPFTAVIMPRWLSIILYGYVNTTPLEQVECYTARIC